MKTLLILILAYFIGAIPTAFILVKTFYGRDIRTIGSRTACGVNVAETLSFGLGILTVFLDIFKAALVMLLAKYWVGTSFALILAPVVIVSGDIWSPFLRFKGSKGLAPIIGILLIIKWPAAFWLSVLFIISLILVKESHFATEISFFGLPFITWWQLGGAWGFVFGLVLLLPMIVQALPVRKNILPQKIIGYIYKSF